MPITNPNERAKRAIVIALNNRSPQLVKITKNDPNDPSLAGFTFTPERLFDGTFDDVGLTDALRLNGFKSALADVLPEISDKIQEDLAGLEPGSRISRVFNVIRGELRALEASSTGTEVVATKRMPSTGSKKASKSSKKSSKG
jgi:hypothetical protein